MALSGSVASGKVVSGNDAERYWPSGSVASGKDVEPNLLVCDESLISTLN